tara:strand:+ start:81 stop:554 length:474 start_codon:yes stop_codon:yes gene_type:complete
MTLKSPYLNSEIVSKSKIELQKTGRTGELARRLNAIISSYNHSISNVARIYNTTNKTVRLWIKRFSHNGIEGLMVKKGRGRKAIFNDQDLDKIKDILSKNPSITIDELRIKIKNIFDKDISKSCCHDYITRCGFSYKTARKKHYKSNDKKQDEFKKN